MHVIFTSSDQAILHFLRLEAWNYSKELWVNEVWHNPHFARRLYASIHFLLGIEKDVITQDKFSRYFCIHCKNSPPIFYRKCVLKGANENLANIETSNDSLYAP